MRLLEKEYIEDEEDIEYKKHLEHKKYTHGKKYVENKVENWIERINEVFSFVKESLASQPEIKFDETQTIELYERLMNEFDVPPVNLPVLQIRKNKEFVLIQPRGLWVVGAEHGRIEILTKEGPYTLMNMGSTAEEPSNWQVSTPKNRSKYTDLNKELILGLF